MIHERDLSILAIQETNSCDDEQLELLNMTCYKDSNRAINRGCALYISQDLKLVQLPQIGSYCNSLDSAWALVEVGNLRIIVGSIYVKPNDTNAILNALSLTDKANDLVPSLKAKGIIVFGDFIARHTAWGDSQNNQYGEQPGFHQICYILLWKPNFFSKKRI